VSDSQDRDQTPQDHGHDHPKHELSFYAKRIYAIRDLLLEKGVITEKDIQSQIEYQEARSPANGAKLVARAWVDPVFKTRLVSDPKAACAEMGLMPQASTNSWFWKILKKCATWWFVPCAPAIRARSWAGRLIGTRVSTIVNGRCMIRVA